VPDNENVNERLASRRAVVGGVAGLGVALPLLAACGSSSNPGSSSNTTSSGPLAKTSEVPVGGAKIFTAENVMVSQPAKGDFKAFSTICTHQGCPITVLKGSEIQCTCHQSKFKVADGSVVQGPATKPLTELKVTVAGDEISVS
jgi:Rieske Fe-S protein